MSDETNVNETETPAKDEPAPQSTSKRYWLDADGNPTEEPESVAGIRYDGIIKGTKDVAYTKTIMFEDFGKGMLETYAAWGALTRMGNTASQARQQIAKGNDVTESDFLDEMLDDLRQGIWREKRGGAGTANSAIVVEAIIAAYAKQGVTLDKDAVAAQWNEKDDAAKKAVRAQPDIAAEIARITAERAAERAAKAAEKAQGDTGAGLDGLGFA